MATLYPPSWYTARPGPLPAMPAGRRPHFSNEATSTPSGSLLARSDGLGDPTSTRRRRPGLGRRGSITTLSRASTIFRAFSKSRPSRPLEPLTSTRLRSSAAALRPLGQSPHAARRPWASETRRRAHATGSHIKGAATPVTAPDLRERGSRIIPVIYSRYVMNIQGLMRAARTNLPIQVHYLLF